MKTILVVCLITAFIASEGKATVNINPKNKESSKEVYFAGAVNGKAFWAYVGDWHLPWAQAKESCTEKGMKLAEINTLEEAKTIQDAFLATRFTCCGYWVAGRDAMEPRQFSWDSTGRDVSLTNVGLGGDPPQLHACLFLDVRDLVFNYVECTYNRNQKYLCEVDISADFNVTSALSEN